uniref:adenylate cyclase n=1 Tax=Neobodo designis TaxID=312471 RepID=A0A6U4R5Y4_NEODS
MAASGSASQRRRANAWGDGDAAQAENAAVSVPMRPIADTAAFANLAPPAPASAATQKQTSPILSVHDVEEKSLLLCAYVARFGEVQREKASRGLESRDAVLRKALAKAIAMADMSQSPALNPAPDSPANPGASAQGAAEALMQSQNLDAWADDDGSDLRAPSDAGSNDDAEGELAPLQPGAERQGLLGDDEVLAIAKPGDEKLLYRVSLRKMGFEDPAVEDQYRRSIVRSEISREIYLLFDVLSLFTVGAAVANGCMVSDWTKAQVLLAVTAFSMHVAYLHYIGTAHGWNLLTVTIVYSFVAWTAALMYRDWGCGHDKDHTGIGSNIIAMYFNQLAISPSFNLETPMQYRMLALLCHSGQWCAAIGLRRAIVQDEVLIWDGLFLGFIAAFAFLSLFVEISMRAGFQATMRRKALQSNRAEHAERTTTALEMMVPAFVVERLLKAARHGVRRASTRSSGSSADIDDTSSHLSSGSGATKLSELSGLSGTSGNTAHSVMPMGQRTLMKSDAAHAMLTKRSEQVWPYPRSLVMFVSFAPPVLTYEAISDTVTRIESVARGRSIQKVKTIGTTVLLVAGIDGSLQFEDAAVNMVEAGLEIQRRVFPARQAEGWWHRVGIHAGAIFGAVIGSQGLAFDIYGDTVTTAAAVAGSAPQNSVRCTGAVRQALPIHDAELGFVLAHQPQPLEIRGKGAIQVFEVQERAVGQAGPRPPSIASDITPPAGQPSTPGSQDTNSDERVPGSVIADSIRSSLRSAAMLPSAAAPVDMLFQSGFMTVDGDGDCASTVGKGFTPSDERERSRSRGNNTSSATTQPPPDAAARHASESAPTTGATYPASAPEPPSSGLHAGVSPARAAGGSGSSTHSSFRDPVEAAADVRPAKADFGGDGVDQYGFPVGRAGANAFAFDDDIAGFSDDD